jgi:stage III sporulation protein AA
MLSTVLCRDEMDSFLSAICNNSLYAHRETINSGFVTLRGGIRVGICGRATVDGGKLLGIYDVSSMNVRIPSAVRNIGEPICRLLREKREGRGVLIYAPPGEGKTTILCAACAKMAGIEPVLRVCVVDSRGEIADVLCDRALCVDILSGYPRGLGIEIATRTMNAELVVCDEIGDEDEARAIISAQNSGVSFLATAHAKSITGLLRRTPIRLLHEASVFDSYVGIRRNNVGEISYTVSSWEEANAALHDARSTYSGDLCS